jgi:hypothetical protein
MKFTVTWKTTTDSGKREFLLASEANAERAWLIKTGVPSCCIKVVMS